MRYILLCLMLVLSTVSARPQAFWVLPNKTGIMMGSCNVKNSCAIDTTFLTISYACIFNNEDSLHCEIARLQVGANYTRFYGLNRWRADSVYTAIYHNLAIIADIKSKSQNKGSISFEIIRNRSQAELYNIHRLAFQHDQVMQYTEKGIKLIWQISEQTRTIGGYLCHEAEACFGGRKWRAWFTTEIPIDVGPWKLSGLPGVILEASDSLNDYKFQFRGITRTIEPILKYQYNTRLVSKKRWMQYEKALHHAPKTTLQATSNHIFYYFDPDTEQLVTLDDNNWQIPYNPIELE